MSLYRIVQDSDRYDSLLPIRSDDYGVFDRYSAKRLGSSWKPIRVKVFSVGNRGDFPSLLRKVPVFSDRAWRILKPLIKESVEALPLDCEEGSYWAINVVNVVDCLDLEKSKVKMLPSGGVMRVEFYVFKKDCIGDHNMFKLPQTRLLEVLVSERFKNAVENNHLEGLLFERVA